MEVMGVAPLEIAAEVKRGGQVLASGEAADEVDLHCGDKPFSGCWQLGNFQNK